MNKLKMMTVTITASLAGVAFAAGAIELAPRIVEPPRDMTGVYAAITNAAAELAGAIEEATGVRPEIVPYAKANGAKGIYLGAKAAEAAGLMPGDMKGFDNVVAEKGGSVYLFGKDRPGQPKLNRPDRWDECILPTVKAVTRFMEDEMGVRFIGPGEVGKEIPKRERIEIAAGKFSRQNPKQEYGEARGGTMMYCIANNIFGQGRHISFKGHTWPSVSPKVYFEKHPEWYALINGKRTPGVPGNPTLCISAPGLKERIAKILGWLYDRGAEVVQLGQNDGDQHCQCEKCRDFMGTAPKDWCEKIWLFHREVALEVARCRPGKIVRIMSYGDTYHPPKTFRKFPSNVMVELAPPSEEHFREWDGYDVPHGFTVYTYYWGEYPLLGFTPKQSILSCAEHARMLNRNNCRGAFRCGYGELFGTEGPGYYVFNKLLEEPELDERKLLEEYCTVAFGAKAAKPMLDFFQTLDKGLRNMNLLMRERYREPLPALAFVYQPERVNRMERQLAAAEKMELGRKQRIRLGLVRREFDYAKNLGAIANLYAGYRYAPTSGTFAPLAEKIIERDAMLDAIFAGTNGTKVAYADWPEIRYFGGEMFGRAMLRTNGRLTATIQTPLGWDAKRLLAKGYLPGASVKRAKVPLVDAAPDFGDFDSGVWAKAGWQELDGFQLERLDFKSRFKAVFGPKKLYVAIDTELPDGLEVKATGFESNVHYLENAEMFIDPTGTKERYYRFIWTPAKDSCWDSQFGLIDNPLDPFYMVQDSRWHAWRGPDRWSYRTEVKGRRWRTMCEVPYALIDAKRPEKGDVWAFNVGRCSYQHLKPNNWQWALWNPNLENRDRCNRNAFGYLEAE